MLTWTGTRYHAQLHPHSPVVLVIFFARPVLPECIPTKGTKGIFIQIFKYSHKGYLHYSFSHQGNFNCWKLRTSLRDQHAQLQPISLKLIFTESLGDDICNFLLRWTICNHNISLLDIISQKVMSNINMLCSLMMD